MKTILLVDANNITLRNFFGYYCNSKIEVAGDSFVAENSSIELLDCAFSNKIFRTFVVWDGGKEKWRLEKLPEYKKRDINNDKLMFGDIDHYDLWIEQSEYFRSLVPLLDAKVICEKGREADDIIAILTRHAVSAGYRVRIVSTDKDFYQLLSKFTCIYNPTKKSAMTLENFRTQFKLEDASKWLQVMALAGDSADKIDGIPQIGIVKATKLVNQFESVEKFLDSSFDETCKPKLWMRVKEQRAKYFRNKSLMDLLTPFSRAYEDKIKSIFEKEIKRDSINKEKWNENKKQLLRECRLSSMSRLLSKKPYWSVLSEKNRSS